MAPRTHYQVLGVKREATLEQIRHAWKEAVKRSHPDTGGSAEEFRAVQDAWECLSNPLSRRNYDRSLEPRPQGPVGGARPGSSSATWSSRPKQNSPWAPPPPSEDDLVFTFDDGVQVILRDRNAFGAVVPSDNQRRTYYMGPAWVYAAMRPEDPLLQVVVPRRGEFRPEPLRRLVSGPMWLRRSNQWLSAGLFSGSALLGCLVALTTGRFPRSLTDSPLTALALSVGFGGAVGLWWPARTLVSASRLNRTTMRAVLCGVPFMACVVALSGVYGMAAGVLLSAVAAAVWFLSRRARLRSRSAGPRSSAKRPTRRQPRVRRNRRARQEQARAGWSR